MNFDQFNTSPKLLVSDSLKDSLHEDRPDQVDVTFISIAIVTEPREFSLTGNLVGIEFAESPKIDLRTSLREAFTFISNVTTNKNHNKKVNSLILLFGEESTSIPGPFTMAGIKIVDIDVSNGLGVLVIDLFKCVP